MRHFALAFATLVALTQGAFAQADWPNKPIKFIIGLPPGSQPDLVTRIVAGKLAPVLGQQVVVENVAGGGGLIAAGRGARSAPDGYTFYLAGLSVVATDKWMFKELPYNPDKDFAPVAVLTDSNAFVLAASPAFKPNTIPELIAAAKAAPGKISYGFTQIGVTTLVGPWFARMAGIELTPVPYRDVGALYQDGTAGRIDFMVTTLDVASSQLAAKNIKALGVTSPQRVPGFDDVPAVAETLPGYRVQGFTIVFAPTGTPNEIITKLNRAIDPIVRDPEFVEKMKTFGLSIKDGARTPAGIEEFARAERDNWANIFTKLEYQPQ
jgi:tripartite-type tricarboxylate transporter receptor subunit TctC